jgi:CheY-like chemotaxis protein/HAMP domain-containing protein
MRSRGSTSSKSVDFEALLQVLAQVKNGDFTARMPLGWTGIAGRVAADLNEVIIANQALETELARVSLAVGEQGKLSQRVHLQGSTRSWAGSAESVNVLIEALVRPTIEMQRVIGTVADGDLSEKMSADVHGEMLELKSTINAMVEQLNGFVSELTRVAREVGTEGKLGQAEAVTIEVGGVWKELMEIFRLKSPLATAVMTMAQSDLRSRQEELRKLNNDLERQAMLLAERNTEAEQKNLEVERSKRMLEEKAGQLVVSSKYKSEFIANMSHELRTPLNSLLMLAEQLEGSPGPPVARATIAIDDHPLAGTTVLVVDDDFRNVFAMTALLERGEAEVLVAENGLDAIALIEQTSDIDLVLMDIMMPEMDGYTAMRMIRALGPFDALPIIAVTGKVVAGERERCRQAGADDYVAKPVNITELLQVIQPWLPDEAARSTADRDLQPRAVAGRGW